MESKIHLRIGRSEENDLVIDNVDIELFHLELFCDANNNVFITDLNSKTGTFVNGVRMNGYTILGLGDIVILGANYELKWSRYQLDLTNEKKPIKDKIMSLKIASFNLNILHTLIILIKIRVDDDNDATIHLS